MSLLAVASRTCLKCGQEFESNHGMRSYCFDCRPPGGLKLPEPLPFERIKGDPFTVDHFCRWASELTLDNGEPWVVENFFAEFLEDFFAGYSESWLLVPEGNTKTTSMSGLGLYHCEFTPYAMALWAAAARDQAELGYLQAEGFIMRSPRLQRVFKCHPGYRRIAHRSNGSRLQVFASDDRTGDGVIPTLGLLDELHRHRNLKLYRTWRGKLLKRGGQLATFSTAGEPGGEFEETREKIRQSAGDIVKDGPFTRAVAGKVVLHEWAVPEGADIEDMDVVKAANPFSGITVEQLRDKFESPTMTVAHWRRFVCNLPTREELAAIHEAEWLAAAVDDEIPVGEPVWLGLDVAWKGDTTAAVPLWWRDPEFRLLGPATILEPPRDGTSLDPDAVKHALLQVHERNPISTVVMDISWAQELAMWLEAELGCTVIERDQKNAAAVEDYERFMEALRNGWLHHTGDPGLTRHVLNAVAKVLPYGDARFARPARGQAPGLQAQRVIDGLVAAAFVHSVAAMQGDDVGVVYA